MSLSKYSVAYGETQLNRVSEICYFCVFFVSKRSFFILLLFYESVEKLIHVRHMLVLCLCVRIFLILSFCISIL